MKLHRIFIVALMLTSLLVIYGFKKPAKKHHHVKPKPVVIEQQPKTLDLAIPASSKITPILDKNLLIVQQDEVETAGFLDISKTQAKPLEMKGQVIMSQEPEIEKQKSADGAGIMINIKH